MTADVEGAVIAVLVRGGWTRSAPTGVGRRSAAAVCRSRVAPSRRERTLRTVRWRRLAKLTDGFAVTMTSQSADYARA